MKSLQNQAGLGSRKILHMLFYLLSTFLQYINLAFDEIYQKILKCLASLRRPSQYEDGTANICFVFKERRAMPTTSKLMFFTYPIQFPSSDVLKRPFLKLTYDVKCLRSQHLQPLQLNKTPWTELSRLTWLVNSLRYRMVAWGATYLNDISIKFSQRRDW